MILWSPAALADLRALRAYVLQDNPGMAAVIVHRIRSAVMRLEQFPLYGRQGQIAGTRELFIPRTSYIVVYRTRDDVIQIARVFHGAQERPPHID